MDVKESLLLEAFGDTFVVDSSVVPAVFHIGSLYQYLSLFHTLQHEEQCHLLQVLIRFAESSFSNACLLSRFNVTALLASFLVQHVEVSPCTALPTSGATKDLPPSAAPRVIPTPIAVVDRRVQLVLRLISLISAVDCDPALLERLFFIAARTHKPDLFLSVVYCLVHSITLRPLGMPSVWLDFTLGPGEVLVTPGSVWLAPEGWSLFVHCSVHQAALPVVYVPHAAELVTSTAVKAAVDNVAAAAEVWHTEGDALRDAPLLGSPLLVTRAGAGNAAILALVLVRVVMQPLRDASSAAHMRPKAMLVLVVVTCSGSKRKKVQALGFPLSWRDEALPGSHLQGKIPTDLCTACAEGGSFSASTGACGCMGTVCSSADDDAPLWSCGFHCIALTHDRKLLGQSQISVYLDGNHVGTSGFGIPKPPSSPELTASFCTGRPAYRLSSLVLVRGFLSPDMVRLLSSIQVNDPTLMGLSKVPSSVTSRFVGAFTAMSVADRRMLDRSSSSLRKESVAVISFALPEGASAAQAAAVLTQMHSSTVYSTVLIRIVSRSALSILSSLGASALPFYLMRRLSTFSYPSLAPDFSISPPTLNVSLAKSLELSKVSKEMNYPSPFDASCVPRCYGFHLLLLLVYFSELFTCRTSNIPTVCDHLATIIANVVPQALDGKVTEVICRLALQPVRSLRLNATQKEHDWQQAWISSFWKRVLASWNVWKQAPFEAKRSVIDLLSSAVATAAVPDAIVTEAAEVGASRIAVADAIRGLHFFRYSAAWTSSSQKRVAASATSDTSHRVRLICCPSSGKPSCTCMQAHMVAADPVNSLSLSLAETRDLRRPLLSILISRLTDPSVTPDAYRIFLDYSAGVLGGEGLAAWDEPLAAQEVLALWIIIIIRSLERNAFFGGGGAVLRHPPPVVIALGGWSGIGGSLHALVYDSCASKSGPLRATAAALVGVVLLLLASLRVTAMDLLPLLASILSDNVKALTTVLGKIVREPYDPMVFSVLRGLGTGSPRSAFSLALGIFESSVAADPSLFPTDEIDSAEVDCASLSSGGQVSSVKNTSFSGSILAVASRAVSAVVQSPVTFSSRRPNLNPLSCFNARPLPVLDMSHSGFRTPWIPAVLDMDSVPVSGFKSQGVAGEILGSCLLSAIAAKGAEECLATHLRELRTVASRSASAEVLNPSPDSVLENSADIQHDPSEGLLSMWGDRVLVCRLIPLIAAHPSSTAVKGVTRLILQDTSSSSASASGGWRVVRNIAAFLHKLKVDHAVACPIVLQVAASTFGVLQIDSAETSRERLVLMETFCRLVLVCDWVVFSKWHNVCELCKPCDYWSSRLWNKDSASGLDAHDESLSAFVACVSAILDVFSGCNALSSGIQGVFERIQVEMTSSVRADIAGTPTSCRTASPPSPQEDALLSTASLVSVLSPLPLSSILLRLTCSALVCATSQPPNHLSAIKQFLSVIPDLLKLALDNDGHAIAHHPAPLLTSASTLPSSSAGNISPRGVHSSDAVRSDAVRSASTYVAFVLTSLAGAAVVLTQTVGTPGLQEVAHSAIEQAIHFAASHAIDWSSSSVTQFERCGCDQASLMPSEATLRGLPIHAILCGVSTTSNPVVTEGCVCSFIYQAASVAESGVVMWNKRSLQFYTDYSVWADLAVQKSIEMSDALSGSFVKDYTPLQVTAKVTRSVWANQHSMRIASWATEDALRTSESRRSLSHVLSRAHDLQSSWWWLCNPGLNTESIALQLLPSLPLSACRPGLGEGLVDWCTHCDRPQRLSLILQPGTAGAFKSSMRCRWWDWSSGHYLATPSHRAARAAKEAETQKLDMEQLVADMADLLVDADYSNSESDSDESIPPSPTASSRVIAASSPSSPSPELEVPRMVRSGNVWTSDISIVAGLNLLPARLSLKEERCSILPRQDESHTAIPFEPIEFSTTEIIRLEARRHCLEHVAVEIFLLSGPQHFVVFADKAARTASIAAFGGVLPGPLLLSTRRTPPHNIRHSTVTQRWVRREITNYEYLMALNFYSGRTFADINQYPVFPWTLCEFSGSELPDLSDPAVYRDLSKPIGALNEARLAGLKERAEQLASMTDIPMRKFLYGSHYSSAAIVLHYLIRLEPFASLLIEHQGGVWDLPSRLFYSIPASWNSCNTAAVDYRELIPELYYSVDMFVNTSKFDFGFRADGSPVDDVILPPWAANNPSLFVSVHREALESEYVSQNLHKWIDLIFGFRQTGRRADAADNLFFHMTYEGAVDLHRVESALERESIRDQIISFGQTPAALFHRAHPVRSLSEVRGGFFSLFRKAPIMSSAATTSTRQLRHFDSPPRPGVSAASGGSTPPSPRDHIPVKIVTTAIIHPTRHDNESQHVERSVRIVGECRPTDVLGLAVVDTAGTIVAALSSGDLAFLEVSPRSEPVASLTLTHRTSSRLHVTRPGIGAAQVSASIGALDHIYPLRPLSEWITTKVSCNNFLLNLNGTRPNTVPCVSSFLAGCSEFRQAVCAFPMDAQVRIVTPSGRAWYISGPSNACEVTAVSVDGAMLACAYESGNIAVFVCTQSQPRLLPVGVTGSSSSGPTFINPNWEEAHPTSGVRALYAATDKVFAPQTIPTSSSAALEWLLVRVIDASFSPIIALAICAEHRFVASSPSMESTMVHCIVTGQLLYRIDSFCAARVALAQVAGLSTADFAVHCLSPDIGWPPFRNEELLDTAHSTPEPLSCCCQNACFCVSSLAVVSSQQIILWSGYCLPPALAGGRNVSLRQVPAIPHGVEGDGLEGAACISMAPAHVVLAHSFSGLVMGQFASGCIHDMSPSPSGSLLVLTVSARATIGTQEPFSVVIAALPSLAPLAILAPPMSSLSPGVTFEPHSDLAGILEPGGSVCCIDECRAVVARGSGIALIYWEISS